jgi:hypothetical protein
MSQNVYLSTKITVKIPTDPIFSGTYTFERNTSTNKWELMSSTNPLSGPSWPTTDPPTNTLLFNTSLSKYSSSYGSFNNQYLIKLNSIFDSGPSPYYPGYMETLARYDSNSPEGGFTYTDAFAWPAHFIMTAIKPPCSNCSIYATGTGDNAIRPPESGYRLVVGFTLPIRYREVAQTWIVVDYPQQVETNRYHALSGINNSNINNFNYITGIPLIVNNSGQIQDFKTTNIIENPDSLFDFSMTAASNLQPVCTGVQDAIGFAFRCGASGFGHNSVSNIGGLSTIDGFGDFRNNFYEAPSSDPTAKYDANGQFFNKAFYENKVAVDASVKFYYSCRVTPTECTLFVPDTPHSVRANLCVINSQIFNNAQCNGLPVDNSYINTYNAYRASNAIDVIDIFYTGPSGWCPCVKNLVPFQPEYLVYESINSDTLKVKIPYGGASLDYEDIISWIKNDFAIIKPDGVGLLQNLTDTNNLCFTQYPIVDVYWNWSSTSPSSGEIVLKTSDTRISYPSVSVSSSNTQISGVYSWKENYQSFVRYVYTTDTVPQISNTLIIKRINETYLTNTYYYVLGSGTFENCNSKIPNSFTPLYFLANTGTSTGSSPLLDTQNYHYWSNSSPKTYGLNPVPSSIAINPT